MGGLIYLAILSMSLFFLDTTHQMDDPISMGDFKTKRMCMLFFFCFKKPQIKKIHPCSPINV